jgi:hypothetical protein
MAAIGGFIGLDAHGDSTVTAVRGRSRAVAFRQQCERKALGGDPRASPRRGLPRSPPKTLPHRVPPGGQQKRGAGAPFDWISVARVEHCRIHSLVSAVMTLRGLDRLHTPGSDLRSTVRWSSAPKLVVAG